MKSLNKGLTEKNAFIICILYFIYYQKLSVLFLWYFLSAYVICRLLIKLYVKQTDSSSKNLVVI